MRTGALAGLAMPAALAVLVAPGSVAGQAVERVTLAIVALRHRIHANTELGNREVETARLVADISANPLEE
ncbi:MAG: hypothetical protein ACREMK_14590 [Gemmatimonadota bacterium]